MKNNNVFLSFVDFFCCICSFAFRMSTYLQLFPTLIVNFAALSAGLSFGYATIAMPQLKPAMDHDPNNPDWTHRPFTLDDESGSWIGK